MQHHFHRIVTAAEPIGSACTVIGAFGLASGSITLFAGYLALLAGSLTTLAHALYRGDKGLLAKQSILGAIHVFAIMSLGG